MMASLYQRGSSGSGRAGMYKECHARGGARGPRIGTRTDVWCEVAVMVSMASDYNALRKLNELVKGIRVAMLTTIREDGMPHSRPMATQQMESDGDLWFFTGWSTHKSHEVEGQPTVNLAYADPNG